MTHGEFKYELHCTVYAVSVFVLPGLGVTGIDVLSGPTSAGEAPQVLTGVRCLFTLHRCEPPPLPRSIDVSPTHQISFWYFW